MINKILEYLKVNKFSLFILGLIIISRLVFLDSVPYGVNQDEAYAGYEALSLLKYGFDSWGYNFPVYFISWGSGMSVLYSYILIPFFYLFGSSVFVLRLPQALGGILACYIFYRILRLFWGKRDALIGFFIVGIMPWGIMSSRFGMDANLLPLFYLLGFYFYLRALKCSNYIFLSAIFYGLAMYAYASSWIFVIISMLFQYAYWLYFKHNKNDVLVVFVVLCVFGILFAPLFLLYLINSGYMEEIKTSFLSIPKLIYWRDNEIGFNNFGLKFSALVNVLIKQNDFMPHNCIPEFGLFYHISLPLIIVGLFILIKHSIADLKDNVFSFSFVILINVLFGVIYALMLYSNINRINYLWYFIIFSIVVGILSCNTKVQWGVLFIYFVLFVKFVSFYFTDYNAQFNPTFKKGLQEAIMFINENPKYKNSAIYFVGFNDIHSSVLFLTNYPTDDFYRNVEWRNFPNIYMDTRSFGRYIFIKNEELKNINNNAIYIISQFDGKFAFNFDMHKFKDYTVAIPRKFYESN